jgi:hypothetical protein
MKTNVITLDLQGRRRAIRRRCAGLLDEIAGLDGEIARLRSELSDRELTIGQLSRELVRANEDRARGGAALGEVRNAFFVLAEYLRDHGHADVVARACGVADDEAPIYRRRA